jgi:hypothetical protein
MSIIHLFRWLLTIALLFAVTLFILRFRFRTNWQIVAPQQSLHASPAMLQMVR